MHYEHVYCICFFLAFKSEVAKIKIGSPSDFMGPRDEAKDAGGEVLIGGTGDDSKGYFIQPTIILTKDLESITMKEEIFGPVITVMVFLYVLWNSSDIDNTSPYALTLALCNFVAKHKALLTATNKLRNAVGNVYYNEKCTGMVVGQQPFGGGRASGTNDKAGSISIFYRFVSARSIKENLVGLEDFQYPSNLI
ncbi:soluble diacylglycerol acyltransferase [Suillus fuscotomentosus]|uniref:Soluble diacylglycerol acyltransferase n=1 Tax=Suillus fuscotomentosus TaxID=1912939 RepID=A0AAD4E967_9AGAM|nr:soluble diacylglycerol acyltransferase [Suillus fuscotomentosus]KAG1901682.1 soluble diacylglycerol acyltransferase [Suillus fuscotomentosus]